MDYSSLFSRAARITWEHKILWLFGFVVSVFGGGYSASQGFPNLGFNGRDFAGTPVEQLPDLSRIIPGLPPDWNLGQLSPGEIETILGSLGAVAVLLACIGLVVGLVFALIQWFGRGALIGLVDNLEAKSSVPTAGDGFSLGGRTFFRLLLIAVLLGLPSLVLVGAGLLVFGAGLVTFIGQAINQSADAVDPTAFLGTLACFLPLACVAGILGWVLGLLRNLAVRAAVIEDQGILASVRRGWSLLVANIGPVLVIWIILTVLGVVFGFVASLPGIAVGLPVLMSVGSGEVSEALLGLTGLLACGYGLVIAALSSVLVTFASATWTLAFRQFATPDVSPAMAVVEEPVVH